MSPVVDQGISLANDAKLPKYPLFSVKSPGLTRLILAALVGATLVWNGSPTSAARDTARREFVKICAPCHGEAGTGTERAPSLVNSPRLRGRTVAQIHDIIKNGTQGGMPAFPLPEDKLQHLASLILSLNSTAEGAKSLGNIAAGERIFFGKGQCASCHMVHGRGGSSGPDLSNVGNELTVRQIQRTLEDPTSEMDNHTEPGCPAWAYCPQDVWALANVKLRNGLTLRGFLRNQGRHDLQLQTLDGVIHLLTDSEYSNVVQEKKSAMPPTKVSGRERDDLIAYLRSLRGIPIGPGNLHVKAITTEEIRQITNPKGGDWPTYNGDVSGNRFKSLAQINTSNVSQLELQWTYALPYSPLETTPLVVNGIMYVTGPNRVCALDSRSGRQIWCYSRPRSEGRLIAGDAARGANRGAALLGNRVFFTTDNAHLICLNALTGGLMWEVAPPESKLEHIGATSAPLIAGDLVVAGVSGGDTPLRGFLAAYKAATGERVWKFETLPKPGEPAFKTWKGKAVETGGGATWLTGSYERETGLLFWPVGNPYPDMDGKEREGSNLYTDCVLALESTTGKLRWYYQFTPHDLHDWDACEPLLLVDAVFRGRERKLLIQANRNGFFYVLDRTNGQFLLGRPFVKKMTWASGIDSTGKPLITADYFPTEAGVKTCPAVRGATNWYASAFNPQTKLLYVMATEDCSLYKTGVFGLEPIRDKNDPARKYLRAIDVNTGKIVWEIPQVGAPETNYSGVLTTGGGLVFYGETGGSFAAVNAKTGETLWHFNTGVPWNASPMTYMVNGRQYIAVAAGSNILSFALSQKALPLR